MSRRTFSGFRAPSFGKSARHAAGPAPLAMGKPDQEETGGGRHRSEGRHGVSASTEPRNRAMNMDQGTRPPAGQHRRTGRPSSPPTGRTTEPEGTWYPTKTDWRSLVAGKAVNGFRLTRV